MSFVHTSCAGAALGVLLWTCVVLSVAILAGRRIALVTLPPLCTKENPLLSVGIFTTDFDPSCLDLEMPEGVATPAVFDFLRGTPPRSLQTAGIFPNLVGMNYATFSALIVLMLAQPDRMFEVENATACQDFWLGVSAEAVGLEIGDIDAPWWTALRNVDTTCAQDQTNAEENLSTGSNLFYNHVQHFLWSIVIETALQESITPLVVALAPASPLSGTLVNVSMQALQLVSAGEEEVCGSGSGSGSGPGNECNQNFTRLMTLVNDTYLEALFSTVEYTPSEADVAIFASHDSAFLARYDAFLENITLASVAQETSTLWPMQRSYFGALADHPLCVASANTGLLASTPATRSCALTDAAFFAIRNRTELATTLSAARTSMWSLLQDLGAANDGISCQGLSTLRPADNAENATLLAEAAAYVAHLCASDDFFAAENVIADAFLINENCTTNASLAVCLSGFAGESASVWPIHLEDPVPQCRSLSRDTLVAALSDATSTPDAAQNLEAYRAGMAALWAQCDLVAYLEMRNDADQAEVLDEFIWTPCVEAGLSSLRNCAEHRHVLDLASEFFETTLVNDADLLRACERASFSRAGFHEKGYLKLTYFFLPIAFMSSVCAFVMTLLAILRGSCVAAGMAPCMALLAFSWFTGSIITINFSDLAAAVFYRRELAETFAQSANASATELVFGAAEGCLEGELCCFRGELHVVLQVSIAGSFLSLALLILSLCCSRTSARRRAQTRLLLARKHYHDLFGFAAGPVHGDTCSESPLGPGSPRQLPGPAAASSPASSAPASAVSIELTEPAPARAVVRV
ncbi:Hypothetical Protein FCC1311_098612 [Hondaea fermentalgiana]|uniref:Uncharacterized protein n=1 Tax=Hondaea fermentalgiana TaxID=2315210 RepID=A0A2R5GV39_9STRA|nr:Hypothetical Protein FCC1311_098612 [Hondaea fermentalgiana]|eukprot:GBG33638.1 Hypothetical Protein FCC1311_098612 [Hondaea fermentalgiana]